MKDKRDLVRVYPIRTSKTEWTIPLYRYHKCSNKCSKIFVNEQTLLFPLPSPTQIPQIPNLSTLSGRSILSSIQEQGLNEADEADEPMNVRYVLVDNPNYIENKCENYNNLERTFIRMKSNGDKNLYEPNMCVIPDSIFKIYLFYPLSRPFMATINKNDNNGYTLLELVNIVKTLYSIVYEEEEKTATPQTYKLKKKCLVCKNKVVYDYVKLYTKVNELEEDCSICYNNYIQDDKVTELSCSHCFHNKCIFNWFNSAELTRSKLTCPLCRMKIIKCDDCGGTGFIEYDYSGVVIPLEQRGNIINRNTTNGFFGIFGFDIDDLYLSSMRYDRVKKTLTLGVGA
jgi:hypothetical protein